MEYPAAMSASDELVIAPDFEAIPTWLTYLCIGAAKEIGHEPFRNAETDRECPDLRQGVFGLADRVHRSFPC